MSVIKKVRRCTECKRVFLNPESFRAHKYRFGGCRTAEALAAAGFSENLKGWKLGDTGTPRKEQG